MIFGVILERTTSPAGVMTEFKTQGDRLIS